MVHRVLLSKQLADEICSRISKGVYRPGDRLPPIQEMAADYVVSISSLREALRSLEIAGVLAVKHGKGVYVSDKVQLNDESVSTMLAINSLKLKTVYEARLVVEVGAIPLVVERASDADIKRMQATLEEVSTTSPPDALARADIKLHMALIECAGNPLLTEMLQPLVRAISRDIRYIHSMPNVVAEFLGWHEGILSALADRDVERCREALRGHLQEGLNILTRDELLGQRQSADAEES